MDMKKVLLSIIMLAMLACGKEEVAPEDPAYKGIWIADEYKGTECISGRFRLHIRHSKNAFNDTAKVFVLPNLQVVIKHDSLNLNKRLHKFSGFIMAGDVERTTNYDMREGDFKVYSKGIGEGLKHSSNVIFAAEYAGENYHDRYNVHIMINSDTIEFVNELK